MDSPSNTDTVDRTVGARVGAGLVALAWAYFFFGIIDLLVGIIPTEFEEFSRFVVLETSWGLLYTLLIPVPLIAWAVRPAGWVGPQVAAIAAAVLVAGVVALAPGQVLAAILVAASAAFPRMWTPRPRWSVRRALTTRALWPLDALVALGIFAAVLHAWDLLDVSRSGVEDDDTWGLMHLPMQSGFALAVPVAAAVAVLTLANWVSGWWFAIVPPTVSAVWFSIVSARHPGLVGSPGEGAGIAVACWGGLLLAVAWGVGFWMRPTRAARGSVSI